MSSARPPDRKTVREPPGTHRGSDSAMSPDESGGSNPRPISVIEISLLVLALVLLCDVLKTATGW